MLCMSAMALMKVLVQEQCNEEKRQDLPRSGSQKGNEDASELHIEIRKS
jgi:hypothetical protein